MLKRNSLIVFVSLFFVALYNLAFFRNCLQVYPLTGMNILFMGSLALGFTAFVALFLNLICWRYTTKPIVVVLLLVSSCAAYFMDSYNIVVDETMIRNIQETNLQESLDLVSIRLLVYFVLLGLLPAAAVVIVRIEGASFGRELLSRLKATMLCLVVIVACIAPLTKYYASFFREHKPLRYSTNPTYYLYSLGKLIAGDEGRYVYATEAIGLDARKAADATGRNLVVFVIGESARADHFSLNGYERPTTPQLQKEEVISFTELFSCGTSTGESVPCMFSMYPREDYTFKKGKLVENVLDIIQRTGVNVLWRENNSDGHKVAGRVQLEKYRYADVNTICDGDQCRDEGMLVGLRDYIASKSTGDIVIVLHQMGSHGPAYYKRYPAEFEKFTPVCKTNQLEECSFEEITNAYDNTILYTDDFLVKTINLLKDYDKDFATTMIYMSDHGESLGEGGVYLHSMPYLIAPDSQKHVAGFFWFGPSAQVDRIALQEKAGREYSHDNIFHTVRGLLAIETEVYNRDLDIVNGEK